MTASLPPRPSCPGLNDWSAARALLAQKGMTMLDRQGGRKIHPAVRVVEVSHRSMMSALRQLALTVGAADAQQSKPPKRVAPFEQPFAVAMLVTDPEVVVATMAR